MKTYKISNGKVVDSAGDPVELLVVSSAFHVEMNPSDVGPYKDRLVTQAIVKEMAMANVPSSAVSFKCAPHTHSLLSHDPPSGLVISDTDRLSRDAQAALRRTMEKYTKSCRFILLATNVSKIIAPLRSRAVLVRLPAPQTGDVRSGGLSVFSCSHVDSIYSDNV